MMIHRMPLMGTAGVPVAPGLQIAGVIALAAVCYWLAAQVGMLFLLERANVSLLWPGAGLALALTCRLGVPAAAGAAMGAFLTHIGQGHTALVGLSVALGVFAAAWLGAMLLARARVRFQLDRPGDVLRFLLVGALPASVASSLVGSGVLWLAGMTQWQGFASLWWICWVADFMGILLLAPALLVAPPRPATGRLMAEATVLVAATVVAGGIIYGDLLPPDAMLGRPLSYAIFPLVIWAAMRFGPALTAWLLLIHAGVAVGFTAAESGPFADGGLRYELLSLHAHLAMVSLTGLLLAATIAGRRLAEEQAREYLHELSHAGRVSAMGEMAGGLAHELNQPLCAIATYAQAARHLLDADADPTLVRALERLDDNSRRAGGIIRQMRGFVSGEPPRTEAVDVNILVRDGLELTAATLRQAGVRVELDLDPEEPAVRVAPVQIHQVLVNLVRNAVEALRETPRERRRLEIRTRRDGGERVVVSVADTGPGVPEGVRESLFEPFVTGRGGGMGLGLSISRSIIEHHEGHLSVTERPGGGALFRFDLPRADGRPSDAEQG
ncbi:ATP-binding protein [Arhodomonas sp. SL1]|uniref:ATP-binding protein n=1 Tax=Arhodomonas sp. SL1 TaxID=3425691 RepID=UPI003F882499